jgi:hypothetical protein
MGHEYVIISKLRNLCSPKIDLRHFKQVKTDCILFQGVAKKNKIFLKKAASVLYEDGSPVYRFLDENQGLKPLLVDCERVPMESRTPEDLPEWEQIEEESLEEHVLSGESVLITGLPGTGKTYVARKLIAKLREAGKLVEIVSKTHVSVQNIGLGAKTADHWTRKHIRNGGTSCDTIFIEEITQIDVFLWCEIAKLLHKGVQFILLGDFRQFPAICATWSGASLPDDALRKSDLVFELAGGNRIELTENRRSDPKIFNFIKSLRIDELDEKPLFLAVTEARQLFPATSARANFTLVMSHKRRIEINAYYNQIERIERQSNDAVEIKVLTKHSIDNNVPQIMWLWPGLRLLGAGHKVQKGIFTKVKACDTEKVVLDNDLSLTHSQVCQSLRLSYAITYASCQGLTLQGRVRLETHSGHLTTRHLYVGISRATSSDLVEVA